MVESVPWIASFAASRGLKYEPEPDERWMRAWEPYATLRMPLRYEHALSATGGTGSLTLARFVVEVPSGGEAQAWIAITQDIRLSGAAAATSDRPGVFAEPMDAIPLPRRATGDAAFDAAFAAFAPTQSDLLRGLGPSLRKLVMGWRIPLHVELRAGGFVLAPVSLGADAPSLSWLVTAIELFGAKAAKGASP